MTPGRIDRERMPCFGTLVRIAQSASATSGPSLRWAAVDPRRAGERQDARRHASDRQPAAPGRAATSRFSPDVHQQGGRRNAAPRRAAGARRSRCGSSTFHRFCARLLRQYAPLVGLRENYTIYDTGDSRRPCKRTLDDARSRHSPTSRPSGSPSAISWAKNNLIPPDAIPAARRAARWGTSSPRSIRRIRRGCWTSNAVDFDDLLLHVATLLRENPEAAPAARRPLSLHPGRRIPGHQSGAVRDRAGAVGRSSESGGDRRSGPVDLRLARGESQQHSRFRAGFPAGRRRAAGAELSQHQADSARGRPS